MALCWKIVTSLSFFQFMAKAWPDAWSVKPTFSFKVTFYLTKTENRTKKSLTALTQLLQVKVLFWPKNADFLQKQNADISKIKRAHVLKGIFSETKYVYVLTG